MEVAGLVDADGAVGDGVIGSLDCLAAVKSSRQTFHVAIIRHASRPLRRSSTGKWISFSGVPKVILFANFSIHSVILLSLAKNMAKLFLVRIPAQSRYSRMGLSSGIPLSVRVSLKSAWRLAMARNCEGLRKLKSVYGNNEIKTKSHRTCNKRWIKQYDDRMHLALLCPVFVAMVDGSGPMQARLRMKCHGHHLPDRENIFGKGVL